MENWGLITYREVALLYQEGESLDVSAISEGERLDVSPVQEG